MNIYSIYTYTAANLLLGLVITAQWELSIGNGFSYTVFSAFGMFNYLDRRGP